MTLPTTTPLNGTDDDSDMFGPPRSAPIGYHHHQRSRVPMISPKLRLREERKRILQLCAHKLERIKDSEANLRRSVCINNTYSRLTDEVRREKQSRYLANLPKSETKPESAHDNIFSPYHHNAQNNNVNYNSMELRNDPFHHSHHQHRPPCSLTPPPSLATGKPTMPSVNNTTDHHHHHHHQHHQQQHHHHHHHHLHQQQQQQQQQQHTSLLNLSSSQICHQSSPPGERHRSKSSSSISSSSSSNVDADLEILDRELNAINASMPLIDPEITQGAEQLEKAVSSRKRTRSEDENDRLVREALSQFYLPTQRLISAIDDCPLDIKRSKMSNNNSSIVNNNINFCGGGGIGSGISAITCNSSNISSSIIACTTNSSTSMMSNNLSSYGCSNLNGSNGTGGDLDLDLGLDININQSQKEFEVIMDALRLGTSSPTPSANDSCGQAAMMSESGVFHNLVVTSLET